jgi:hypothetical protein
MIQRLKRIFTLASALSVSVLGGVFALETAHAQKFGAGLLLGEPTGLSGKYWQTPSTRAIQGGLAWSFDSYMLISGDYLFHFPAAFGAKTPFAAQLNPYVGIGGVMFFGNNIRPKGIDRSSFGLGLRIPLGIEWRPADPPIGVFLELTPGIGIVPGTYGFFMGGIGARYYF